MSGKAEYLDETLGAASLCWASMDFHSSHAHPRTSWRSSGESPYAVGIGIASSTWLAWLPQACVISSFVTSFELSLSRSVRAALDNKMPQPNSLLTAETYFWGSWRLEGPRSVQLQFWCLVKSFLVQRWCLLAGSQHGGRDRAVLWNFLIRAWIPFMRALITFPGPEFLNRHLVIGIQCRTMGVGHKHSDQSSPLVNVVICCFAHHIFG